MAKKRKKQKQKGESPLADKEKQMTIIEQSITGKHTASDCEDGIVVTDCFAAVIDGSTSKTAERVNPAMTNGRYCMTLIADYISTMPPDSTLESFCQGVTEKIRGIYDDNHLTATLADHPEERLCASAVVYSDLRKEIWMVGDCQCMVNGEPHTNGKPSEERIAARRAELFRGLSLRHPDMTDGHGHILHDYARDAILPDLIASMKGENKTYAVIDGFPIHMQGVKLITLPHSALPATIALASDGYPFLCATLQKSEKKLATQLARDPYNIDSFVATKGLMRDNVSFDDRAYLRLTTADRQRYALTVSYDGTAYHGWQIQPNGMSVQERLQDALTKILRHKTEVTGAGRTDAGVHAKTMVCHFDYVEGIDCPQLVYRLNQLLPQDISCSRAEAVKPDFHARFSAKRRTYRYFIHTDKNPFLRHYSVETHYKLDFALMNEAARWLTTVNDFRAFCKAGADNKTTICHVSKAEWVQTSPTEWYFEISADRFLRNMVRAVVGTLFDIGRHRITIGQFKGIVGHGSRSDSGDSMPAHGLFLWEIDN